MLLLNEKQKYWINKYIDIINELYKIIFFKNSDNSILQEKYINKENLTENENGK